MFCISRDMPSDIYRIVFRDEAIKQSLFGDKTVVATGVLFVLLGAYLVHLVNKADPTRRHAEPKSHLVYLLPPPPPPQIASREKPKVHGPPNHALVAASSLQQLAEKPTSRSSARRRADP
jgi:hypothetical protein